jgi:hypothetical protein
VDNPSPASAAAPVTPAPAAAPVDTTPAATVVTDTPASTETKSPPKSSAPGKVSLDIEKSYSELRREFTQRTQAHAQERKAWETHLQATTERLQQLETMLKSATATPYDPDKFMDELRTHGPKSLEGWLKESLATSLKGHDERFHSYEDKLTDMELKWEILRRRLDPEKYPDFSTMEAELIAAAQDEATPIDFKQPIPKVIDSLYNLVKLRHSQDALKAAEQHGRQKTEEQLAAEAASAVAGGGTSTSPATPDYSKMSPEKMREDMAARGLVAER